MLRSGECYPALAIGVDIGGTRVKIGAINAQNDILAQGSLPFQDFDDFPTFTTALHDAVRALEWEAGGRIATVGVACPGNPHPLTGHVADGLFNLPILQNRSVVEALRGRGLPVALALNDAVAAALGEQAFGAARGLSRFAFITLGTGVGGCIVMDGKPVLARDGQPPEIGAMVLGVDGPVCGNGLAGTLEAYAAAAGFTAAYVRQGGAAGATPVQIFAAADAGDIRADAAIDAVCRRIAQAFGIMINLLNVEACLVGGGISQAGPRLVEGIAAHLPDFTWGPLLPAVRIGLATTGNAAGWLGAARAASQADGRDRGQ